MIKKSAILTILIVHFTAFGVMALEYKNVHIHGFVSQGYLQSDQYDYMTADTEDGTFQFNEIGLNFMAMLTDNLHVGIQFLSRDLGKDGNNDIEIDWAYGDYLWKNWFGLRAGMLKVPFGLFNENRDLDMARTWILLPRGIYNELNRALWSGMKGVGIYGDLPYGFSYQALVGQLDDGKIKDRAERSGRILSDVDLDTAYVAQIVWNTPLDGLLVSGSFYDISGFKTSREITMGPPGTPSSTLVSDFKKHLFWVASLEYSFYDFKFFAEYYQSDIEMDFNLMDLHVDAAEQSYYFGASYRFTDWFELGGYYSEYYEDKDNKNKYTRLNEIVLTTRFDINDYWIVKLEGHAMDGLNGVDYGDEDDPSEDWFLFAAKVTFTF